MKEIWKPVVDWEGMYEVSNKGRVRSIYRIVFKGVTKKGEQFLTVRPQKLLKECLTKSGYSCVYLTRNNKKKTARIHQLVAAAFIGPKPHGTEVCHKDHNKLNNKPENLEYKTHAENLYDSKKALRNAYGVRNGKAKLNDNDVREIRKLRPTKSLHSLGNMYGVSHETVRQIFTGKTWGHVK